MTNTYTNPKGLFRLLDVNLVTFFLKLIQSKEKNLKTFLGRDIFMIQFRWTFYSKFWIKQSGKCARAWTRFCHSFKNFSIQSRAYASTVYLWNLLFLKALLISIQIFCIKQNTSSRWQWSFIVYAKKYKPMRNRRNMDTRKDKSSHQRCSAKTVFLKISQISQENTSFGVSFY